MTKKVYNLMDWAAIEAVTYSEADHPKELLGAHAVGSQTLIQLFIPDAKKVSIRVGRSKTPVECELADESGYFACLIKRKYPFQYTVIIEDKNGKTREYADPYSFENIITEKDLIKFADGIHYHAYEILGAHVMEIDGVKGTHFAVWAPNAMRVSVVGDFNEWDGRIHQMERLHDSGIFELFIPGVEDGAVYKFELKKKNGTVIYKSDPYEFGGEMRPKNASVVRNISDFSWTDEKWLKDRARAKHESEPMLVYELHLASWKHRNLTAKEKEKSWEEIDREGLNFMNYRKLAPEIAKYVHEMGYTHIELMPVMEHPFDNSEGYQITGYYAPTRRYGSPEDFAWFMNYMHSEGIGVILDWSCANFPKDDFGLEYFDGTHLYESDNMRRRQHPDEGTWMFDFSKPQVKNYLIASALFWVNVYHADGIRINDLDYILYLDFGKGEGDWDANIYGGRENLEGIEFIKHLTSVFAKNARGSMIIAEESAAWSGVTAPLDEGGLGFDYKWNSGWKNDFLGYMAYDPYVRTNHYGELCFPMIYAYSEKYILPFSHNESSCGMGSLLSRMSGNNRDEKFANMKAAFGFFMTHPGKKHIFMGQDLGEFDEWNLNREIQWGLLDNEEHKWFHNSLKDLIALYREQPALYSLDHEEGGFEWINCISANENIVVYLRKTKKAEETLLIVVNFENVPRKNYKIGVPFEGKYKEIFNSDSEKYGGFDFRNTRSLNSDKDECDGREDSIRIKVPPLAISVFKCTPESNSSKKENDKKDKE